MSQRITRSLVASAVAAVLTGVSAHAATQPATDLAINRLKTELSAQSISRNPATGAARFVRIAPETELRLADGAQAQAQPMTREREASLNLAAAGFLNQYGAAFGLRSGAADLELRKSEADDIGQTHLTYEQRYKGLPVFGSALKVHFDGTGRISVVNGTVVPDINVATTPRRTKAEAEATAIAFAKAKGGRVMSSRLLVYREGLVKGVPGENRLAYEVEVMSAKGIRDFVYIDAVSGKPIDKISGTPDALSRRAFDAQGAAAPGPNYPGSPYWVEGDPFPTASTEANNMIQASKETYDLYKRAFGRDSFDGAGATMDSIFNRGNACPNASWNGVFISFCPGLTTDDVTAHEWSHAYTQYTDGLVYAWQSGALNEASSDIFGEIVDRLNTSDAVPGNNARDPGGACTVHTVLPSTVTVNSPAGIAGVKQAGDAAGFGDQEFDLTADVVLVDDGIAGGTTTDGCETPYANAAAVAGKIALVDRGLCTFTVKAANAQANGAAGILVANNAAGPAPGLGGVDPTVTIPVLSLSLADGNAIKANFPVNATMTKGATGTDNSARWLVGEDSTAVGLEGALRDMWEPNCYGNPNRVGDPMYWCDATDNGGVHINSGVDNRAFSLVVDGGTHNGVQVFPIGLTKAAHIWFRAKLAYQNYTTDFAEHADALEQSCKDLKGKKLKSLTTGALTNEKITAGDCNQIKAAMQAVEMRATPACGFQPLLAQSPPAVCPPSPNAPKNIFVDNFEKAAKTKKFWTVSNEFQSGDFGVNNWAVVGKLPDKKKGKAFFAGDPDVGTCNVGDDATSLQHLDLKPLQLPANGNAPRISFEHWVATEAGWDGGNVKISVNGGPYTVIPQAAFIYNPHNATLIPSPNSNNPLAGQRAFTGADQGSTQGTWGTTIIDLTGVAAPGDIVRLRFDLGADCGFGGRGWFVDNFKLQQCR
ncbi:MAG TPA: M4 family metallopeptidase [Steroidobacteraceae bacterium]|nr:M4 family metallopeptidase [Steroidobacteraceae bacterium]